MNATIHFGERKQQTGDQSQQAAGFVEDLFCTGINSYAQVLAMKGNPACACAYGIIIVTMFKLFKTVALFLLCGHFFACLPKWDFCHPLF